MRKLEDLFDETINIRGIHNELELNESTVRSMRKLRREGKGVSVEKMREVLTLAGYRKVQEEYWD